MKKFLSITICLILCLSSMMILGACKKKEEPVPVDEAVAMEAFNKAMVAMQSEQAVKISCVMPESGESVVISSQDKTYTVIPGMKESWKIKNGEVFDVYTIENDGDEHLPNYTYTKSNYPAEQEESENVEDLLANLFDQTNFFFGGMEIKFVSAYDFKGELTISFNVEYEDVVIYGMVFTIVNEKITSMSSSILGIPMVYNFNYGEQYLLEIPEIPTNITWNEI